MTFGGIVVALVIFKSWAFTLSENATTFRYFNGSDGAKSNRKDESPIYAACGEGVSAVAESSISPSWLSLTLACERYDWLDVGDCRGCCRKVDTDWREGISCTDECLCLTVGRNPWRGLGTYQHSQT